jgi:hypothetical protein
MKPGRKRIRNHELPVGIYEKGGKYRALKWDAKGLLKSIALCITPEEAEYRRLVHLQGHHWLNMEPVGDYFGFTYLITNKSNGKQYVGKKQFYLWSGPVGGFKCTDPRNEWWDPKAWRENEWRFYTGSCDELNVEIQKGNVWDYKYEVLEMCHDRLSLHISEINHMILWDVLYDMDPETGDYRFYNKNIASLEFRPPFKRHDLETAKSISENAMRHYYLKPNHCPVCKHVIPYGQSTCCTKETKSQSLEFNDVR